MKQSTMEERAINTKDLIKTAFSSRVAVLCSPPADSVINQFNLNFAQLVQPFAKLTTEVSWQDPNGQLIWPKDIYMTVVDISAWKKSDADVQRIRRLLNTVVSQTPPPLGSRSYCISKDNNNAGAKNGKDLEGQSEEHVHTKWFETWRKAFLKLQSEITGSQHEFLSHFVACIMVISSSEVTNSEDIANVVGKLSKVQQQHQYDHPNTWILPSVLKFYLIVQDGDSNDTEAERVYQNFRTMYGGNFCHMLKLATAGDKAEPEILNPNPWQTFVEQEYSVMDGTKTSDDSDKALVEEVDNIVHSDVLHPLSPDCEKPPSTIPQNGDITVETNSTAKANQNVGALLTSTDVRRIQVAVNEFISKALLPYMERQCRNLHESILNRRGMSKSFFSATKRLFGTSNKSTPSVVYASESVEILSRKLSDIYFLFGHYGGAYQLYHQLKKDFYGDAAWLYYASSLELAAISHFMMSQSEPPLAVARAFPVHYVNDAIGHYIDQCRMIDAATRCAVLCAQCLKHLENNGETAAIYIRMTSEDCDLRSALMLEQAACAFLEMNSPRKYALHCVLSGYRYAKAGLKSHALNCYRQGYQIYNGKGWRYAEDHVNYTIARLQNVLQIPDGTPEHLTATLISPSPQSTQQIQTFYKEFLATMAVLSPNSLIPYEFFVPIIKFVDMKIRIAVADLPTGECPADAPGRDENLSTNWDSLEEAIVRECINRSSSVISFKPTRLFFSGSLDNTVHPSVPCNEQFFIELPFHNPLKIPVSLRNITLKFDHQELIQVSSVSDVELEPECSKILRFSVVSQHVGLIVFESVYYELEFSGNRVLFQQPVKLRGHRLNSSQAEFNKRIYAKDVRNKIVIVNSLPLLQARVDGLPKTLFHAETVNFHIVLEDKSNPSPASTTVSRVIIAMDNINDVLEILPEQSEDKNNFTKVSTAGKSYIQLKCNAAQKIMRIPCFYKAPQTGENAELDILLVYEILDCQNISNRIHRVVKNSIQVPLSPAIHLEYSSLKMLDCFTHLGLLRLYNLTVDYNITINKIFFSPSDVEVVDLCSSNDGDPRHEKDNGTIKMNKLESRNIVLKFLDRADVIKDKQDVTINVKWEIANHKCENMAIGNSQMKIREAITSIGSTFIFEIKHKSYVGINFEDSTLCYCDVELIIHSRNSGNFSIELENNPPKEDITSTSPSTRASGDIFLMGKTSWLLKLNALQTEKITYKVAVAWPGVYNAAPKVVVTDVDRAVQECYSLHSPIIVAQTYTSTVD